MMQPDHIPSRTIQLSPQEQPQVLVLKLKNRQNVVENEREKVQSTVDKKLNDLTQTHFGQSIIPHQNLEKSLYQSMTASHLNLEEDSDAEDIYFDVIDDEEQLEVLNAEIGALNNATAVVETEAQQIHQIGTLELLGTHLSQAISQHGSRFATALITGGTGIAVATTATTVAGPLFAIGTTLIAGKEILNMAFEYVKREGASEHIKVIEAAIDNIEQKRKLAEQSIEQAQQLQENVNQQIGEVQREIEKLTLQLQNATGTIKNTIEEALGNQKKTLAILMQQGYDLENAIQLSKKSMLILQDQGEQIQTLLENKYEIKNESQAKAIVGEILSKITEIKQSSENAYTLQLQVTNNLMKAVDSKKQLIVLNHNFSSLFAKMELMVKELEEAKMKTVFMEGKVKEAQKDTKKLGEELEKQKKLNVEQQRDIQIAKEQLDAEKKTEKFGEDSVFIGGGGAMVLGAGVGAFLLGPIGMALGGVAYAGLGKQAIRGVHLARKTMRANEATRKKLEFEKLKTNLEHNKPQEGPVTVKASYGYSQGHYLGAAGAKAAWNFVGSLANYAAGKEVMGEAKSNRSGTVECLIGTIPFKFEFDKLNENFAIYGAIPLSDQMNLRDTLASSLKNNAISPNMILKLLNLLSKISIGNEIIVMINPTSKVFQSLIEECQERIKNQ